MAIYHLSVKSVGRSSGRSATAAAAYRSGSEIADERTGEDYDYTRKQGVEHAEIVLPDSAAQHDINWPRDRAALWNAAELAEKRKDSRVAREYEVALPAELDDTQRLELVREFSRDIANRYGCAVDFAIHAPHRQGDQRNHHAHLLATTRQITPTGMGAKTAVELSNTDRKKRGLPVASREVAAIRGRWAEFSNRALERHGHKARIDHRSLAAQREDALQQGDTEKAAELDREPTKHLGVAATALERKGQSTDLGEFNRRIAEAAEAGRLQREGRKLDQSILDLSTDLAAALKERDSLKELQRSVQPDGDLAMEARRQAREALAQMQAARTEARKQFDLWKEGRGKDGLTKTANPDKGVGRGPGLGDRLGLGRPPGGMPASWALLDRFGQGPVEPQELERLLRELQEREVHEQRERDQGAGPGERKPAGDRAHGHDPTQSRGGRDPRDRYDPHNPHDTRTQAERDRENDHRRHRDRGLDR